MGQRKLFNLLVGTFVLIMMIPVSLACFAFNKSKVDASLGCTPATSTSSLVGDGTASADNVSLSAANLTVKGAPMTADQAAIAAQIAGIVAARSTDFPGSEQHDATIIALITAIVESQIQNLDYGTGSSLGVFQQQPGKTWGTAAQTMNVGHATNKFLDGLLGVGGWDSMAYGNAAQAVQRSGHPDAYALYISEAEAIYQHLNFAGGTPTDVSYAQANADPAVAQACADQGQMTSDINTAISAALSKVGSDYTWGTPPDGAGFVSWAYGQAGIKLPTTIQDLANWSGDSSQNVSATWIPASQIESGEVGLQAGDIDFWSDGQDDPTRDNVTRTGLQLPTDSETGTGGGTSFSIATWNIKTGAGYQQRVDRAAQLITSQGIDIVGFQEVEHPQIYRALAKAFKGTNYALYPANPAAVFRNNEAAVPILYNTDRFTLLPKTANIAFRRMDDAQQPAHVPVIWLQDKQTGQSIIVANTHSPAYARYAKQRYEANLAYVQELQQLKSEGLPIFFTGDFNSGYWMVSHGNTTYQNNRANTTYCQLTANGLMEDSRDVLQGLSGTCPRTKGNGPNNIDHVYVSPGVEVSGVSVLTNTLSDHNAIVVKASVPAAATGQKVATNSDTTLKVATYNVLGAVHTAKTGAQSGAARAVRQAALIRKEGFAAVGLQEFESVQRKTLMQQLGSRYQVYPTKPYYKGSGVSSENSIIWDTSQVEFLGGGSLPMPYYFGGSHRKIPIVELRQIATGAVFYVVNTHDPAHRASTKLRYLDALQHAKDADKLVASGIPLIFTGDFNSSYALQGGDNPTFDGDRSKLTVCIMTQSGSMRDAYDASKGRSGTCPQATSKERPGVENDHIFVSNSVAVTGYHVVSRTETASDHSVVYADLTLSEESTAATSGISGTYVGPNPEAGNKIAVMPVGKQYFAGVLRLSLSNATVENAGLTTTISGIGQSFVGNDGFSGGSCVAYVEYILKRHSSKYHGQVDITSGTGGVAAYTVAQNLGAELGYTVNHTPAIHATVSFSRLQANPQYGHVALVAQINQDGSIVVEEANWSHYNMYGRHTVPASEVPTLTYAHTEVGWH